jgi:hypothetical protein
MKADLMLRSEISDCFFEWQVTVHNQSGRLQDLK